MIIGLHHHHHPPRNSTFNLGATQAHWRKHKILCNYLARGARRTLHWPAGQGQARVEQIQNECCEDVLGAIIQATGHGGAGDVLISPCVQLCEICVIYNNFHFYEPQRNLNSLVDYKRYDVGNGNQNVLISETKKNK